MEILGTHGIVRLNSGFAPGISLLKEPNRDATTRTEHWQNWTGGIDPATEATFEGLTGYDASHRRVVRDWLQAIAENREPLGSGERAMKAIEMAHGVFQAGITGRRVEFPLVKRTHPLVS
jgi:predicted dehydrogenase